MKTHIETTETKAKLAHAVESAVYLLSGGFPVALPTETVYGLAAWALNKDALFRIFSTKERPQFDPLIVHIPTMEWLDNLCVIPLEDRRLVDRLTAAFWPGPLTIVLPRKPKMVPDLATSGLPTVALRMSAHPVFKEVIEAFGQPLAAPSANRFGRVSPTQASHVMEELRDRIHLIVDAGPTQHGVESTIVTVRGDSLWILRNGPITAEELGKHASVSVASAGARPIAPGQLKSHYAPSTPMRLLPPGEAPFLAKTAPVGLLAFCSADNVGCFQKVELLSKVGDLKEAATNLFAKLRLLDSMGLNEIVVESVPETGLGAAIMDRLRKAAAAHG